MEESENRNKEHYKTFKKDKDKDLPYNPEITEHDLDMLEQKNIHGDGGDDQMLRDRMKKVDFAGSDLDVPGRKKASKSAHTLKDEENQLYSQGGDDKDNLEEDKPEIN